MKRLYTISILLALAIISATAQISEIFDRYADTDGVTSVYISKSLLRMMPDVETDGVDLEGISDKLDSIRILTTEDKSIAKKLKKDITKSLRSDNYEVLLMVNESKEETMIYMKPGKNSLTEYLIISHDSDEFNIIRIVGRIKPGDVRDIVN